MRTKSEILGNMSFIEFDFKAKNSFKFFCEELLGITTMGGIHNFQLEWVNAVKHYNYVVIKAATGHSKTMTLGVWHTLWQCYKNDHLEILVVSKNLAQAKNTFRHIRNAIELNPILSEILGNEKTARSWNEQFIETKQFNTIRVVPYTSSIRSFRAHIVYCDEVDSYEETETYFEDVLSRLHPVVGRIILTSTPKGSTNLLAQIEDQDIEGKYHSITTPAIVRKDGTHFNPETFTLEDFKYAKSTWPESFPLDVIKEKWFIQGKWKFISQQLCKILGETENTPFSLKTIINCYDKNLSFSKEVLQEAIYFIGNDFASSTGKNADFTTYVVIEFLNEVFTVKWIEILPKGTQTPEKMTKLKELYGIYNEFGSCRVVADATNLGVEIVPKIRNAGISLIEQPFQWRLRREMIKTVSNVMQNGGSYIRIPKMGGPEKVNQNKLVDELQKQLAGFLLIKSAVGNENYKSTSPHDDIAIAFMMALKEASKMSINMVSPRIVGGNNQIRNNKDGMVRISGDGSSKGLIDNGMMNIGNGPIEGDNPNILRNRRESLVRIVRK